MDMNKELKIFILGARNVDKNSLVDTLLLKNDNINLAKKFSTDKKYENTYNKYFYYLDPNEVILGYKNNSFLCVKTYQDNITIGTCTDDLYNNNVFTFSINEFNNISEIIFNNNNILVIWLDTKFHNNDYNLNKDILETNYLLDRLNYVNYMYFLDEDIENIADTIIEYMNATDERKEELLQENL